MKRVLLINDSKLENAIMKDMLSSINYEVGTTDEYHAIKAVQDFCPDYIITNYIMKEINGDQLAAVIKVQYPNVKCIISSSNPIDIGNFDRKKINAVIKTPIDRNELKRVLENVSNENAAKQVDSEAIESNKHCNKCGKLLDFNFGTYFFCPFCGNKI
ncbi:MAG TPA: response regulator [Acetivibrio clariflavus]|nr:response regulator [Acetivibrio clariflavus]